jgi:hypothetical protein
MTQPQFFAETYQILDNLDNLDTDDKTKLLLSIILNLENRLTIMENKFKSLQQDYSSQFMKCSYCHEHKLDVKQKINNNRNFVLSCEECYSKIFF